MLNLDRVYTMEQNGPRFHRVGAPDPQALARLLNRRILTLKNPDLVRMFEIDITLCPLCGGQLRVIADITDPDLIRKILDHVNSRALPAPAAKARRITPDPTQPIPRTLTSLQ